MGHDWLVWYTYSMDSTQQEAFYTLSYDTLSRQDDYFIHQHIVDAFTAQTANKNTKPIAIAFALAGLYLFLEKGYTGREVQNMHAQMGKEKRIWPKFDLPQKRGEITVQDVLATQAEDARDDMIKKWCHSVWDAYGGSHKKVEDLLQHYLT